MTNFNNIKWDADTTWCNIPNRTWYHAEHNSSEVMYGFKFHDHRYEDYRLMGKYLFAWDREGNPYPENNWS